LDSSPQTVASLRRSAVRFAKADHRRAIWQLTVTLLLFGALWAAMALVLEHNYGWALLLAVPAAGMFVRLFIIQHDCGHGSFFSSRRANEILGGILGVVTLFPYGYWKKTHAIHHSTSGNLDRRELGDVDTLTVREYQSLSRWGRLRYRLYRHPITLFLVGPIYQFVIKHRFPFDIPFAWKKEWASVLWTNLALGVVGTALALAVGWKTFLLVQAPILVIAGAAGVWLFYVQHQFEHAYWERKETWDPELAALQGSSFYDLPRVLHWFTGNIGYHHLHHLVAKIPNYRLRECFEAIPALQKAPRLTLRSSLRCARLKLWDEQERKLVGFPRRRRAAA